MLKIEIHVGTITRAHTPILGLKTFTLGFGVGYAQQIVVRAFASTVPFFSKFQQKS